MSRASHEIDAKEENRETEPKVINKEQLKKFREIIMKRKKENKALHLLRRMCLSFHQKLGLGKQRTSARSYKNALFIFDLIQTEYKNLL